LSVRVKICGINSAEAYEAARDAGADWVGLVFHPASPRYITPGQAAALIAGPGGPVPVGLFVAPRLADVEAVLRDVPLRILQCHRISDQDASALRQAFGLPVWRAFGIASPADLPAGPGGADAMLLDAKPPPDSKLDGGTGLCFDWSMLRGWHAPGLWLLAGGLTPENVARAIAATAAPAVDVSSGVESSRGVKDTRLIQAFIRAANRV
jgi:phosphoribosylanthranilate isomerase